MWCDQPRLPPLVIRSINDMEDIPIREAQALAGQAAVPRSVIVKQSSTKHKSFGYILILNLCVEIPHFKEVRLFNVPAGHKMAVMNFLHYIIQLCFHVGCDLTVEI